MKGEGGTDTLRLGEVTGTFNLSLLGDSATYQGFEVLDLAIGSGWTVTAPAASRCHQRHQREPDAQQRLARLLRGHGGRHRCVCWRARAPSRLIAHAGATISPGSHGGQHRHAGGERHGAFNSGSTYAVTVTNAGTNSDRIAVSGATTLSSGASVSVQAIAGLYNFRQTYTILTLLRRHHRHLRLGELQLRLPHAVAQL